jgi:lipid A ethanolaminephosphotransferase
MASPDAQGELRPAPQTTAFPHPTLDAEAAGARAFVSWLSGLWGAGWRCPGEISFAVGVAAIWVVGYNGAFWSQVAAAMWHPDARTVAFMASLAVLLTVIQSTVVLLAPTARTMRALASALFIVAAVAAYFIGAYNAILSPAMMRNVLQTDAAEVSGLVSGSMLLHIVLLGVLPAALVWRVRWRKASLGARLRRRTVFLLAGWFLAFAGMFGTSASYAVLLREHKPIRYAMLPMAPVIGATRVLAREWKETRPASAMDQGGPVVSVAAAHPRPLVVLLVVGESARAASFELGGYARPTNPKLQGIDDLLYFDEAWSCDTSTAVSVPCMFSPLGRDRFDVDDAGNHANLLDTLQKAGVDVEWWDNNSGCKGVCRRVPTVEYAAHRRAALCPESYCFDEIMLEDLRRRLGGIRRDTLIVYHQIGSHGPAYSERYPPRFEAFVPSCHSSELHRCTAAEVRNAYDNTIMYTDYVLSRQIEILNAAQDRLDTVLLYVSDHGESLGEQGLYLHGMPYALAPEAQTHVPMLAWLPDSSRARLELDYGCLQARAHARVGHDDLYHTVLGVMELRNDSYDPQRDLLAPCMAPRTHLSAATAGPGTPMGRADSSIPVMKGPVRRAPHAGDAARSTLRGR